MVSSSMETYFREIHATPLLDARQEKELAYRIENGDAEARDHMVRANLRLVVNIASRFSTRELPLQDLIAEGNLGLLRAVEAFDPSRNTRFSTYAGYWIKQSIKRGLMNTAKTIRIPAYMVELLAKWRRIAGQLHDELGRTPTQQEVARELGVPQKQLACIERAMRVYNCGLQSVDDETGSMIDEMMDKRAEARKSEGMEAGDLQHVLLLLDKMDQRGATVLRLRFGLDGEDPKTLKEIGERVGLTRERVRQIESEALSELRGKLAG